MGLAKNILAGIGALVVLLIVIGLMGSHDNTPQKPSEPSLPTMQGNTYALRVNYDGEWSGTLNQGSDHNIISGNGPGLAKVSKWPVSASIQKKDGSYKRLTVDVLKGSQVIRSENTTAGYGKVTLTAMPKPG